MRIPWFIAQVIMIKKSYIQCINVHTYVAIYTKYTSLFPIDKGHDKYVHSILNDSEDEVGLMYTPFQRECTYSTLNVFHNITNKDSIKTFEHPISVAYVNLFCIYKISINTGKQIFQMVNMEK